MRIRLGLRAKGPCRSSPSWDTSLAVAASPTADTDREKGTVSCGPAAREASQARPSRLARTRPGARRCTLPPLTHTHPRLLLPLSPLRSRHLLLAESYRVRGRPESRRCGSLLAQEAGRVWLERRPVPEHPKRPREALCLVCPVASPSKWTRGRDRAGCQESGKGPNLAIRHPLTKRRFKN